MARAPSRPERWSAAVAKIEAGLSELESLKEEYEDWQNNLPDNAQDGPTAEKLEEVVNLDLDSMRQILDEAQNLDLPLGFGRD